MMQQANDKKRAFRPGKKDWIFAAVVIGVLVALALGSGERKAHPTPSDEVHQNATARAQCMRCHGTGGVRPQPAGHTKMDQCFMCHQQPEGWRGAR